MAVCSSFLHDMSVSTRVPNLMVTYTRLFFPYTFVYLNRRRTRAIAFGRYFAGTISSSTITYVRYYLNL